MLSRPLLSESSDIMHAISDSDTWAVMDIDSTDLASLSTNGLSDSVDHDTDVAAVEGPPVLASVTLAQTRGESRYICGHNVETDFCWTLLARNYPCRAKDLAVHIGQPELIAHIKQFLFDQLYPDAPETALVVDLAGCPTFDGKVDVFHSALASFYAPSDLSGLKGLHQHYIRCMPQWRGGPEHRDCVFAEKDVTQPGMGGLHVVQVLLLFQFTYMGKMYPCALVRWFLPVGDHPCLRTGMWMVKPQFYGRNPVTSVIHIDSVMCGAHLIGMYGIDFLPSQLQYSDSLMAFAAFYVNKYSDYHAYEVIF